MQRTIFILICMAVSGWVSPGDAVPVVPSDPPMSAERIARLPSEIRTIVLTRCGAEAEAGHYFATYDDNSNAVRLDYSLLQCPNAPERCAGSSCVQTFVRRGGKYIPSRFNRNHARLRSQGDYEVNLKPGLAGNHASTPKPHHLASRQRLVETQKLDLTCPGTCRANDIDLKGKDQIANRVRRRQRQHHDEMRLRTSAITNLNSFSSSLSRSCSARSSPNA